MGAADKVQVPDRCVSPVSVPELDVVSGRDLTVVVLPYKSVFEPKNVRFGNFDLDISVSRCSLIADRLVISRYMPLPEPGGFAFLNRFGGHILGHSFPFIRGYMPFLEPGSNS